MDRPNNFLHGYHFTYQAENPELSSPIPTNTTAPSNPSKMPTSPISSNNSVPILQQQSIHFSNSDGEVSFNDSGYLSTPSTRFTCLSSRQRGSGFSQQGSIFSGPTQLQLGSSHSPAKIYQAGPSCNSNLTEVHQPGQHYRGSPARVHGHGPTLIEYQSGPKPNWPDSVDNFDEWEGNFIDNFQENLFDSVDINNMVDSLMTSPLSSPFKSLSGVQKSPVSVLSPFKNAVTSNVMLAGPKRSPGRLGMSPLQNLFSSPSPVRGFASHTKTSPVTRQRRLILPSPAHKSESPVDQLSDLPDYMSSMNEEEDDDLGVMPFARSNSFGFTPQDDAPSSAIHAESSMLVLGSSSSTSLPLQEIDLQNIVQILPNTWSSITFGLPSSPLISLQQESLSRTSPSKTYQMQLTPGQISITKHSQLINNLPSKETLRFMRAYFKRALDKASADAYVEETNRTQRLRARSKKKPQQFPEISQAPAKPVAGTSKAEQNFTSLYAPAHRTASKRRQEILPKPSDWPGKEPCRIAPKKRKR